MNPYQSCWNIILNYTVDPNWGCPLDVEKYSIPLSFSHITWLPDPLSYPILPKAIPEQQNMNQDFYKLYQKQEFCDFGITSSEGSVKVHSNLLYLYGGEIMQKLLTSNMKEKHEKAVSFTEYSHPIVLAFIDFIYLGGKAFYDKILVLESKDTIDLSELFVLANTYQLDTLIDCCTNLMSLTATPQDLETLQHLAEVYNNEHLQQLCAHLLPKENTVIIKA